MGQRLWRLLYRGGNSICATPNSLDMIIADGPKGRGDNDTPWLEVPSRYSIAAYTWYPNLSRGQGPLFEVYDAEREVTVGVRRIPTPQRAADLLGRYGVPESEVEFHEPIMVPEVA